jgi:hypothetical protein
MIHALGEQTIYLTDDVCSDLSVFHAVRLLLATCCGDQHSSIRIVGSP